MARKVPTRFAELRWLAQLREFLGHYIGGLYRRAGQHHIFLLAGGLAFSLFACFVPLMFIIFAVLGNIFEKIPIAQEITALVNRLIPYPDYAASIEEFLISRVDEFKVYKNLAGVIGFVGLLFGSSGLFSSMRTILNMVYGAKPRKLMITGKLRDLGLVGLVLLYFLLSTTVLPAWGIIKELAQKIDFLSSFRVGFLEELVMGVGSFVVIVAVFYTIYLFIPQTKLPKRVIGVSALSAAILWLLAEQIFGLYIAHAATLKRVYGAFTLLIMVALWIYYSSTVFILSAEIGQLYRERLHRS